ncbi:MAG: Gfo/Idh/MocA family oxidoreductase [Paenibacillaceae bacterium]
MNIVRVGIVGMGNMGKGHAKYLYQNEVVGAQLTAVCDEMLGARQWAEENLSGVRVYSEVESMLASGVIDAVIVATPHYSHPGLAIRSFELGLHVMIEKPAGVYTKEVRTMNDVAKASGKVFGIVYNQRTNPLYQTLRDLVMSGELGEIRRTNWIITSWYRSQSYYNSGGWRATWSGEGGGVLINQCPHQLDLWQWTTGLTPKRMRAFCSFGKYRNIEVEDEVTAYVEYENGATGVFITTIAEPGGTNRYEIVGDRGKVIIENEQLSFWRLRKSEPEFNATYTGGFGEPEQWKCEVPINGVETGHKGIVQNWIDGIVKGTPLLASGEEGIHGLTLSNAMLLSTWTDNWVDLPLDEELFYTMLQDRIASSEVTKHAEK